MSDLGNFSEEFPGAPDGERTPGGSTVVAIGTASPSSSVGAPNAYVKARGGGRANGAAAFAKGEVDFLRAWLLSSATYQISQAGIAILQGGFPVKPPNGPTDFSSDASITRFTVGALALVEVFYLVDTRSMDTGRYTARFTVTATTPGGDTATEVITVPFRII